MKTIRVIAVMSLALSFGVWAALGLCGEKVLTVTEAQLTANMVPVLFVHGSQESDLVKECFTETKNALPEATLKVIENGDHSSTVASPEYHSAVVEFIRKHSK